MGTNQQAQYLCMFVTKSKRLKVNCIALLTKYELLVCLPYIPSLSAFAANHANTNQEAFYFVLWTSSVTVLTEVRLRAKAPRQGRTVSVLQFSSQLSYLYSVDSRGFSCFMSSTQRTFKTSER